MPFMLVNFLVQTQEVEFASFLPGEFTEVALVNPPDKKMVNPTSAM